MGRTGVLGQHRGGADLVDLQDWVRRSPSRDGKTEGQDGLRGLDWRNAATAADRTAIETADGRDRVASCCTAWPAAMR